MKKKQPETIITDQIRDALDLCGIFHWKQWQGMGSKPGVSDILGVLPDGKFLAIEVKTPTGRVSDHQQKFIDKVNASGGVAFVARSLDDVLDTLGLRNRFLF